MPRQSLTKRSEHAPPGIRSALPQAGFTWRPWSWRRKQVSPTPTTASAAASLATQLFDDDIRTFLLLHPEGTVVQVGSCVQHRFARLDNARAHWVELDCTGSHASPTQLNPRLQTMHADLQSPAWHRELLRHPGPFCFVSERHLLGLDRAEAERALELLLRGFPGSWMILDTSSSTGTRVHRLCAPMALPERWKGWSCDDLRTLRLRGAVVDRSRTLLDETRRLGSALSAWDKLFLLLRPRAMRSRFASYKVSRLVFSAN